MTKFQIPILSLALLAIFSADALAQSSKNVAVTARLKPGSARFNDVWGYRDASTGKEYAIFGSTAGTYIADCTNGSAIQRGYIPATRSSSWRDMKVVGEYAYVVTESAGGMQIIDLRNPDQPRLAATWGTNYWSNAHGIAVDEGTGLLYAHGTGSGMHVIDVSSPTAPRRIAQFSSPYIHDMSVQDGYAHAAFIYSNEYAIIDVSKLPSMPVLGKIGAPGSRYCHNTWPTRDNNYCVTTNEASGGPTGIFDITNKRAPKRVATWHTGGSRAIVHNAYVRDRVVHLSHYTEGYQALDLSNPSSPQNVGYYDTWPGSSSGYNGAWGCYPFQPSGHVYLNDISTGLYVLKPKCAVRFYGSATKGATTPEIHAFGAAYAGNSNFAFQVENAGAGKRGSLVISAAKGNINLKGLRINVNPSGAIAISFQTNASGEATVKAPVPSSVTKGLLYAQAFVMDANGPLGVAATRGMEVEAFLK